MTPTRRVRARRGERTLRLVARAAGGTHARECLAPSPRCCHLVPLRCAAAVTCAALSTHLLTRLPASLNPHPAGKFADVQNAYEVLSNDRKRAAYNQHGHSAVDGSNGGGEGPFSGGGQEGFMDAEELFAQFFGGGAGGRGGSGRATRRCVLRRGAAAWWRAQPCSMVAHATAQHGGVRIRSREPAPHSSSSLPSLAAPCRPLAAAQAAPAAAVMCRCP